MTSFLGELQAGRLRWDLLHPFPVPDPDAQAAGAAARHELAPLLAKLVDPEQVEARRELPPELAPALAAGGFLRLSTPASRGGRGLPRLEIYRLLESAGRHHTAVGIMLAWHNVLGIGGYQELLPPGPLPELVAAGLAGGKVYGLGDSERTGASDARRGTVAEPTADGRGYLLTGEKQFVGNASIADLLTITATVRDGGRDQIDMFLVDTGSEGFSVVGVQELVGLAGSPIGALRLDRVYVPAQRRLTTAAGGWRSSPAVRRLSAFARMAITVSQTLGPARECLGHVRDFLHRRQDLNGRPLADYKAVQRRLAGALGDLYAADSAIEWGLLGEDRLPELTAAKNIGTMAGWRVIDEAVSLLGGEGVETAASKRRRGLPALPVERALRDARCLRVAGGVDFNIDQRVGWSGIFAPRYPAGSAPAGSAPAGSAPAGSAPGEPVAPPPAELVAALTPANQRHLGYLSEQVAALDRRCTELVARFPEEVLAERQELQIAANRISDELYTMAVALARAARLGGSAGAPEGGAQQLAAVYCAAARGRVADAWRVLATAGDPGDADPAGACRAWLTGALDPLLAGG